MRKRVVVICPGRGSYTSQNLGYLKKYGLGNTPFVEQMDRLRADLGEIPISELDAADKFKVSVHTKGEHASPLIYACSYVDFMSIDSDTYEVVAICGNSMGWYLALSFAGVLNVDGAFHLIQTMGSMMRQGLIGQQFIYPVMNEKWQVCEQRLDNLKKAWVEGVYLSIRLGGYYVLAGEKEACQKMMQSLEPVDDFPMTLINHGAFHTPLLQDISRQALSLIPMASFGRPQVPLVDGRGHIWSPFSTSVEHLWHYTLVNQVLETYDFSKSVEVALKEFCPDHLVLLGPGNSLGGALGQCLIQNSWRGIVDKESFLAAQEKTSPMLISMGLAEQRERF